MQCAKNNIHRSGVARTSAGLSVLGLSLLCTVFPAVAEEAAKPWSGESEFGVVVTNGNTKTENLNFGLALKQQLDLWENTYGLSADYESQNNTTSAEKYSAALQTNRKLSGKNFAFAALTYDDDRFSGFDYEASISLGFGRRILEDSVKQLDVEIGPGHRVTKIADGNSEGETVVRTAAKFRYELSDNAHFTQSLTNTQGEERSITKSETALSSKIIGSLAMKVALTVKYNSEPATAANDNTDTESSLSLVYSF